MPPFALPSWRSRRSPKLVLALACALGGSMNGAGGLAYAQTPAPSNVSVDATAPGAPIERIWPFHGYDEANYTTTAPGEALLATLGAIHTSTPHIRTHFLLNTGDGTASMKWG